MPKKIQGAKIVLLNSALEIEKTKSDSKLNISSPDQMQNFLNEEEKILNPWLIGFPHQEQMLYSVKKE